jgi:hypothetical protein
VTLLKPPDHTWHLPAVLFEPLHPDGRTLKTRRNPRPGWTLPTLTPVGDWSPGAWVTAKSSGPLSVPGNGVLVMGADTLLNWAQFGTVLAEVEVDGDESATDGNRIVVRRARPMRLVPGWTDETILSWGFECIDRAIRVHLATALESAGLPRLSNSLKGIEQISDPLAARTAIGALERLRDRDDIGPGSSLWRVVDAAMDAATHLAAPEIASLDDEDFGDHDDDDDDDDDDEEDQAGLVDEEDDEAGPGVPHYTETAAWWEAQRISAEERAAKYAAKASRWTCYCAAECVAMGAASRSKEGNHLELAGAGQDAEYRLQAERLAEVIGV